MEWDPFIWPMILAYRVANVRLKEVEYDRALPEKIRDEAREQFLREATVLARLDHPNLPKVSDFFSNGPRDYLVMDYVPGNDLRTLLMEARRKKSYIKEKEVLSWADQIANALTFLHMQEPPIVHRDIKPSNLKLMPQWSDQTCGFWSRENPGTRRSNDHDHSGTGYCALHAAGTIWRK